ncbi:hypothetical protein CYLTODRAFT_418626 [Cylindrobasidium torrendii FP15055 ss-10]|uniref:Uncharacterized protein n=1 Tax=Cylindrobasidium torrendii FP15055 ss-10 TaxID=1314674 RepID=A0A0D7BMP7_9AGAR|nr:hypothetical protein CYLTODRAFT_418626 [Cylindrobasidium torrendii FP15055 ss-10]
MSTPHLPIDDKALLGENNASGWASEAKEALKDSTIDYTPKAPPLLTADSTPLMPGGFKREAPADGSVATTLLDTAKQYIPQAVLSYLPGVTQSAPTSLPSQEPSGDILSDVGVGSLPGHASETSVAKLPEERSAEAAAEAQSAPSAQPSVIPPSVSSASALPSTATSIGDISTHATTGSHTQLTPALSTTDTTSTPATSVNAVDSPQPTAAPLVPLTETPLPTAPLDSSVQSPAVASDAAPTPVPKDVVSPPSPIAKDSPAEATGLPTKSPSFSRTSGTKISHVYDTPAPPLSDEILKHSDTVDSSDSSRFVEPGSTHSRRSSVDTKSKDSSGSTKRRSSVFNKMKGELKVISGKLSHNDAKVAEGKKLLNEVSS